MLGAFLAAAAPTASAAPQRYASPNGSGTDCTAVSPCTITEAVEPAYTGGEVILAPGDYPLATALYATGITVHGVAGRPRPRLLFKNVPSPSMHVRDSTLGYVEVVVAPGPGGIAILAEANGALTGGTFRNVTAIATEVGVVAIKATAAGGGLANVLPRKQRLDRRGGGNQSSAPAFATRPPTTTARRRGPRRSAPGSPRPSTARSTSTATRARSAASTSAPTSSSPRRPPPPAPPARSPTTRRR